MSHSLDLKELERRAFRSVFQDGLWDIYLGLILLAMAVSVGLNDFGVAEGWQTAGLIGVELLAMAVLWAGKHFLTLPRMGQVRFGEQRRKRITLLRLLLGLSVLLGLAAWLIFAAPASHPTSWMRSPYFIAALWLVNIGVLAGFGAYLLDYERLLWIGALFAISVPLNELLNTIGLGNLGYLAFGLPAMIILIMGGIHLACFLREHPIPDQASDHAS
jgi:hypothetical protein